MVFLKFKIPILLVIKIVINFCISILYHETILKMVFSSRNCFADIFGFPIYIFINLDIAALFVVTKVRNSTMSSK